MNPLILFPFPIGSLQSILAVGSSDTSGAGEGLDGLTVLLGVACAEAAGPQDVRRTRREVATRRRITVKRNYFPNGYASS